MSLTLDAGLQTVMDGLDRHPIVELISKNAVADIPFDGQYLSTGTINEQAVSAITHSTGRLCVAFAYGPDSSSVYTIKYGYTDTARTTYTYATAVTLTTVYVLHHVSICEMADGNIGIIYLESHGGAYYLHEKIITVTGASVSGAQIDTWATTLYTDSPSVIKLADDSYLMVYACQQTSTNHYHLWVRTSADFTTWSAAAEIPLSGLTDANKKANPYVFLEATSGDAWLLFHYVDATGPSGEELTNIYYCTSSDSFSTASAPAALTSYATYAEIGQHPSAVQKTATSMHLIYDKVMGALHMDDTTTGWPTGDQVSNIMYDAVNGKIYVLCGSDAIGGTDLQCIVKIDLATWAVDDYWDTTTTPGFPSGIYFDQYKALGSSALIPWFYSYSGVYVVWLLDGAADTITTYAFTAWPAASITANVDYAGIGVDAIKSVQVDEANNRLYVTFVNTQTSETYVTVGYIDITQVPAAGATYTFNKITDNYALGLGVAYGNSINTLASETRVYPDDDLVIISGGDVSYLGFTAIFSLSTGALAKLYTTASYAAYPRHGLRRIEYKYGILYGAFAYEANYGEDAKRGLCLIDIATDTITFSRPGWASYDEYGLQGMAWGAPGSLIIAGTYGVSVYDTVAGTWLLYDNTTVPGLTPGARNDCMTVAYDAADAYILAGFNKSGASWDGGLILFSESGQLKQTQYLLGALDGTWSFAPATPLVQGYADYEASCSLDPDDASIYCFWTRRDGTELSIVWDRENSELNLGAYLVAEDGVRTRETIRHRTPGELTFSVSDGHLFDITNTASLYNGYLAKGRQITLRRGDKIAGVDTWQAQGEYYVTERALSYQRGVYPVMNVKAQDATCLFKDRHVIATDYYETTPDVIAADILEEHGGVAAADTNISPFANGASLDHQWIETTVGEMLEQLLNHFGYFLRVNVDGTFTCRRISESNTVDHAYATLAQMIKWTPDDTYSDFTNRVTVTGQERTFMEVLYAEERVASLNGSHGWNSGKKDYTIYYSADRSRRCRSPRLEIIDTATSIAFGDTITFPHPISGDTLTLFITDLERIDEVRTGTCRDIITGWVT